MYCHRHSIRLYGPFRNCQAWSLITVHSQWPRKHKEDPFTRSKQIYRIGRSLKFYGPVNSGCSLNRTYGTSYQWKKCYVWLNKYIIKHVLNRKYWYEVIVMLYVIICWWHCFIYHYCNPDSIQTQLDILNVYLFKR